MNNKIIIRRIEASDCQLISDAFRLQGWNDKPVELYESYYGFQESGVRDVLIAEWNGVFAGYLTISWESGFEEFRDQGIPEIVDFNVLKKYQRLGIGTRIMNEAEDKIKERSDKVGIAFGLMKDYGPAQILYIRRGYVPWGNGLTVSGKQIEYGDSVIVDHGLVFHLSKQF